MDKLFAGCLICLLPWTGAAAIDACGTISPGTVWTNADSPVNVICDLQVAELTIEPDVEVLVADDYEIVVSGIIRALGTEATPIVFRSAPANSVGWGGFYFEDAVTGSEFRWTQIEGATSSGVHLVRSSPTFDHVTFRNNSATRGAAIQAEILDQDLVISNSLFENNQASVAGGAIDISGPSGPGDAALVVTDSIFRQNYAGTTSTRNNTAGGAIAIDGHSRIAGSTFSDNESRAYTIFALGGRYTRGGAIYMAGGRSEISASTFLRNACRMAADGQTPDASRAHGGALHLASGELDLRNSLLADNTLISTRNGDHRGAGLYVGGGSASLVNTTLADNDFQAVHVNAGQADILNSILFFNNAGGEQITGSAQVTYSNVQNGYTGEGNIAVNPILDVLYRIVPPSLAIDAGNPDPSYDDLIPPGQGSVRNDLGFTGGLGGVRWNNPICYRDADGDGYGDAQSFASLPGCSFDYVLDNNDCDDTDEAIYPGSDASCPDPATLSGACGLISPGTVWTNADSPVNVICDLQVAELTIEPDVEVLVADDYEIVVSGVIRVLGTEASPIVFRSAPANTVGWGGFHFEDAMAGSEFRWTQIEGATSSGVHLVRSSPTFDHVTFRNNSATRGAAIQAEILDQDLVISNSLFENNQASVAGGAIDISGPSGPGDAALVVTDSIFRQNYAGTTSTRNNTAGGAIAIDGHSRIAGSTFSDNESRAYTIFALGGRYTRGGAIYMAGGRSEISASTFLRNACRMGADGQTPDASRAHGGALHLASGELDLRNSLLADNTLISTRNRDHRGAGLYVGGGSASLVNTTLADNDIQAVHVNAGQADILNSILFFNNAGGEQITGSAQVTYSNVQNGYTGEGNIAVNPIFDALYRIIPPSPAIDAGNPDPSYDDLIPPGQGIVRNDLGFTGGPGGILPVAVDMDANGLDGPVIIPQGESMDLSIALRTGGYAEVNADWRILAYYYDQGSGNLIPVLDTGFESVLFDLQPTAIMNTSILPPGIFVFLFGVDINPNSVLDDLQISDTLIIAVQ